MRLTYCGNVHQAEDLVAWRDSVERATAAVARGQPQPFGIGAWWSAATAAALAHDRRPLADVREALSRLGLELWTLNAFPFGGFHDAVVGTRVYAPSWAEEERLQYTRDVAVAAAALAAA